MIISHKHKFIFIKNRKVAGTSVEVALAQICGPDDILSSDSPELSRSKSPDTLSGHARNFQGSFDVLREIKLDYRAASVARVLRDRAQRHRFYNHMRAVSIKARVEPEIWDTYYKFCFDRNPWDKMISFYYWYNRKSQNKDALNAFICEKTSRFSVDRKYPTDWDRYTLKNRIIVDDVFDYAGLEANLNAALIRAGVSKSVADKVNLPRMKSDTREVKHEKLSSESNVIIERVFENEIREFGYECPEGLLA